MKIKDNLKIETVDPESVGMLNYKKFIEKQQEKIQEYIRKERRCSLCNKETLDLNPVVLEFDGERVKYTLFCDNCYEERGWLLNEKR